MFMMFNVVALYLVATSVPTYTIHVRELTKPEQAVSHPVTGSECVHDAVTALKWAPADLARVDIWIARGGKDDKVQVLRVNWGGLSQRGLTATNYQLLKGDRLFLQARGPK